MQTAGHIGRMKLIITVLSLSISNMSKNLIAGSKYGLIFEPKTTNRMQMEMFCWEVWQRKIVQNLSAWEV